MDIDLILNKYYQNNAKELKRIVNKMLDKYNFPQKDYDEFYSIANETMNSCIKTYDNSKNCSFDTFLWRCIENKIYSELKSRSRIKRKIDQEAVSLDALVSCNDNTSFQEIIPSTFNIDDEINKNKYSEEVEEYLNDLTQIQKNIILYKAEGMTSGCIKEKLHLTDKEYNLNLMSLKEFSKLRKLNHCYLKEEKTMDEIYIDKAQTSEKSKPKVYPVSSILKKMENYTIRFDHPLQRESEQWSPAMKGNLISDILQNNPIPELIFAEQLIDGISIIWDIDGKQRCTTVYSYIKNIFKVSKNIRKPFIKYQKIVKDENGNCVLNENKVPIYKWEECDIRGKYFKDLPEALQEKILDYNFNVTQYLNCTSDEIAYHIERYNAGKPMNGNQKGLIKLGETFATMVKNISGMEFFKNIGNYKVSENKNGAIGRLIVESVMGINFLDSWKKNQEDMCEFLLNNATQEMFENFEELVERITNVVDEESAEVFDSKDSFIWFTVFSAFTKTNLDDKKFINFIKVFTKDLHNKKVDNITYDDLNQKATKDKNVVINKIKLITKLMYEFFNLTIKENDIFTNENIKEFIKDVAGKELTNMDINFYKDILNDLETNVNNNSLLLKKDNEPSLLALVAYACEKDIDLDDWIVEYFNNHPEYIKDQKENYLHMKEELDQFVA